jgi:CTP synthase (UTP-ammonia lyase)
MLKGIEFVRNVLGIAEADSTENNSGSKNIVIYLACVEVTLPNYPAWYPRSAFDPDRICNLSTAKKKSVTEEFSCNVEVNSEYEWCAIEAGFPVVTIESPAHRFFIATPFQPQLSSTEKKSPSAGPGLRPGRRVGTHKTLDDSVLE